MKKILIIFLITFLCIPSVFASSGSLKASTVKECEGNLYGQHGSDNHWHLAIKNENGGYSAKGDVLINDPCPLNIDNKETKIDDEKEIEKITIVNNDSSNVNLKEVLIDGESIDISDTIEYKTTKEKVDLEITAENKKAKVAYDKPKKLEMGNNIIDITVSTSDNSQKRYVLIIVREKELSSDTAIEIKVDDEVIEFKDNKTKIEVKNDVTELNLEYKLNDENAKVEIIDNEDFVTGKNDVKIIVTAENGNKQEYIITVVKLDWFNSIIKVILGSGVVVTILGFLKKIFK